MFEITQSAMDQLGGGRRGARRKILHFGQCDRITTADGIAGDAAAVDAATDDEQIVHRFFGQFRLPPLHFALHKFTHLRK